MNKKNNEEINISFRINKSVKEKFYQYAEENNSTVAKLLQEYIYTLLKIPNNTFKYFGTCIVCGNNFQTNHISRKYCSNECSKIVQLANRKGWEFKNKCNGETELSTKNILALKSAKKCFYCGCELNDSNRTIDHVIPLSKGGKNTLENVVPCCFGCNNKKGTKTIREFLAKLQMDEYIKKIKDEN